MMIDNYKPTPQAPIGSGFGPQTTAREVLRGRDLKNTIAIVTGGHSGLGLETTHALTDAGATVIIGARNAEKARAAVSNLSRVEVEALDLIDPVAVDAFALKFLKSGRPLHILINNAGIMAPPLVRDARGYESQFATNHLGHFQLTVRLWPALKLGERARVVSLSSTGIRFGGVDFDDPNFERHAYDKWRAYGQSKSANALFAVALDRRGHLHGIRAFAVHPGRVLTELARYLKQEEVATEGFSNTEQGAATSVWCATSPQLEGKGGVFCMSVDLAEVVQDFSLQGTSQIVSGVIPWAIDPALAERLWQLSEQMTRLRLDPSSSPKKS